MGVKEVILSLLEDFGDLKSPCRRSRTPRNWTINKLEIQGLRNQSVCGFSVHFYVPKLFIPTVMQSNEVKMYFS